MDAFLIRLLNMSLTASWLVLAVVLLRLLLKKAPKWIMGVLWGLVAIRLIVPFSLESAFSLIPSAEPIPQNILLSDQPTIHSGVPIINRVINPMLSESLAPHAATSINPMQVVALYASVIWMVGMMIMLFYMLVSGIRIRRKVREAVPLTKNIWSCDHIATPFILGMIRPRIYLPSSMNEADMKYVIFHEKAHCKRKDHIWKPLGFLLLSVYWFNPILWVAYLLLCKDIELACDEKVIRQFGTEMKKPYSDALIHCSVPRKMISACPLAFGETGVKERVKGVLNYKKPAFWIVFAAAAVCVVTAVCLLTNPRANRLKSIESLSLEGYEDRSEISLCDGKHVTDLENRNKETIDALLNLKISNAPVSQNRSEDRDATHSIVFREENSASIHSDASDTSICFNKNYSEVFVNNGVKPTLSYRVLEAGKAQNIYESLFVDSSVSNVGGAGQPDQIVIQPSVSSLVYHYSSEKDNAALSLEPQSQQFTFAFSMLSSYLVAGTYEEDDELIVARGEDGNHVYTFRKDGQTISFVAEQSSPMPMFAYSAGAESEVCVPDGAVFQPTETNDVQPGANPYFNAEVLQVNERSILVKPDADSDEIKSADTISVSLDVVSTVPAPILKVGDRVRIVYNGEIAESYPAQISKVFAIYLLRDDGEVLSPASTTTNEGVTR